MINQIYESLIKDFYVLILVLIASMINFMAVEIIRSLNNEILNFLISWQSSEQLFIIIGLINIYNLFKPVKIEKDCEICIED